MLQGTRRNSDPIRKCQGERRSHKTSRGEMAYKGEMAITLHERSDAFRASTLRKNSTRGEYIGSAQKFNKGGP